MPLSQMLDEARVGKLQLPDFQRGWVWDDDHIASLLASISLSYPIGAVMTLQTGNPSVRFRPRLVEGVPSDVTAEPELLLLDGQQRLTSLYLALKSGKPVPTSDSKNKRLERRYFADIKLCLDEGGDREEAIFGMPADGVKRNFRSEVILDLSSKRSQIENEMFPLEIVLDYSETTSWQLEYLATGPGNPEERLQRWMGFNGKVINAFVQYQVPTIQLIRSTPKEAVCQVFEKVNTGGVPLTVFELLTATYSADDFKLRDDWEVRAAKFSEKAVLRKVGETEFLQVVTLLATQHRRAEHLQSNPEDDRPPAVSCKRADILRLPLEDYIRWADTAMQGLLRCVPFLHGEHIFKSTDLPYATQVVPLGAIFAILGDRAEGHGVRQQIRQWYWSGVFGEMYGGSTETRFAMDVQDVVHWIAEDGTDPRTIQEAQFQADRLLRLRQRLSAAYKGLFALQMKRGGRDFRTGNTIDVHDYEDDAIDIHHIFPRKWCADKGIDQGIADCVVNKTAIDAHTNRRIGSNAPSKYLQRIETSDGTSAHEIDSILQSHDIDPVSLRQDDFQTFFNLRFERLLVQIQEAMGKPVNRRAERDESPFKESARVDERQESRIRALIAADESKVVEFKSTARRNLFTKNKDEAMEQEVVEAIAAFMNASGGTLLVGVGDDKRIVGIQEDFPFLGKKQNADGWELWLTDLLTSTLGKVAASEVLVAICDIDGKPVARVDAGPAASPVFASFKGKKHKKFFVRINNRTEEMSGPDLLAYESHRWPN